MFDFDGVLAEDVWPSPHCGAPIPEGIAMLRYYAFAGYECSIYTSRPAAHLPRLWDWVRTQELINLVYTIVTDKPAAWIYIDDRGYRFER